MNRISKVKNAGNVLRCEIASKFHQLGAAGALKLGVARLFRMFRTNALKERDLHPFDLQYGTDTSGVVSVGSLDIPAEGMRHAVRYQTALIEVFEDILAGLEIRHEEFVFVDLGSGKGRALLLASRYPFKSVIGVELSPALHRIACRNIEIFRDEKQKCWKISSNCEDAAKYQIPSENLVLYLFNPFDAEVMRLVLHNIESSFRNAARRILIAYLKPVHRSLFDQSPLLQVLGQTERFVIYETKPDH